MSTPLQEFIDGACSPARYEPDLALNLEICEVINKKQGNAPREAAMAIVQHVNSKNMNQAMLALTLLDNCVKNCGYPFHLQIATKDFLNELVRKFPERPAPFPNPVIQRILYMIKEWKVALADMSRHKDDLVNIKEMYRLLKIKGYRFPELRSSSVAALAPSEGLKSAEELEEEDRVAQSAKLQELIRRGRPQDLVEANHLMKIMSGYDQRQQPDYRQKFEEELHKIQEKAILLYEMLERLTPNDKLHGNETIMELKGACNSAQPKIQKLITEEENAEKIENLLALNDIINNAMAKFADIQKGIYDTQYEISGKAPTQTSDEPPRQAISLIDLDDEPPSSSPSQQGQNAQSTTTTTTINVLDELSDLFGPATTISSPSSGLSGLSGLSGPAGPGHQSNPLNGGGASPNPLDVLSRLQQPSSSSTSSLGRGGPTALPAAVSPTLSTSSLGTPTKQNNAIEMPATDKQGQATQHASIDLVNKNGLQIVCDVSQVGTVWRLKAYFSNHSTAPMEKLMLRLAAPRSMQLKMEPQSDEMIPPKSHRNVTQIILVNNPNEEPLRLRYKVTYQQFGVDMELTGDYHA